MENSLIVQTKLKEKGINIDSLWDLVNSKVQYGKPIIEMLMELLRCESISFRDREAIVRSLTVKEAKGLANDLLLKEYERLVSVENSSSLKWAIGNAFETIITKDDVARIIPIVLKSNNGTSRQMFVSALGKVKTHKSITEDVLISLLEDKEVIPHAIIALRRLKSEKAKPILEQLQTSSNPLIRREAKKALNTLIKP